MTNTMQTTANPPTPHEAVREGLKELKASPEVTRLAEQVIATREKESRNGNK